MLFLPLCSPSSLCGHLGKPVELLFELSQISERCLCLVALEGSVLPEMRLCFRQAFSYLGAASSL